MSFKLGIGCVHLCVDYLIRILFISWSTSKSGVPTAARLSVAGLCKCHEDHKRIEVLEQYGEERSVNKCVCVRVTKWEREVGEF